MDRGGTEMKILLALMLLTGVILVSGAEWVSSYRTAKKQAIAQNKKILIFFSGSDWCESGRILNRDLFRTRSFQQLASEKYILYNADFPKYTKQGQEQEDTNKQLAARYGIHRFPALVVVEPKYGGLLVKQIGVKGMTPKMLLDKLTKIEADTAQSYRLPRKGNPAR